jgi:hypothetical protein
VLKSMKVVEDERDLALLGQAVDEIRQDGVGDARSTDDFLEARRLERRARSPKRLEHVRPEHDRVVVTVVERDPGDRTPLGFDFAPRTEQGCLAATRRSCHNGEPDSGLVS